MADKVKKSKKDDMARKFLETETMELPEDLELEDDFFFDSDEDDDYTGSFESVVPAVGRHLAQEELMKKRRLVYELEDDEEDEAEEEDDLYEDSEEDDDLYDDDYDEDDEDYEDDEDDDEEGSRFTGTDLALILGGVAAAVLIVVAAVIFLGSSRTSKQHEEFASVGAAIDGIDIIGEQGLVAITQAKASGVYDSIVEEEPIEEEPTTFEEKEYDLGSVQVEMSFTSIQKDLKIKFLNKSTGKLIASVPFSVTVIDADKKTYTLVDDDMDGIIYKKDIVSGTYSVAMDPLPNFPDMVVASAAVNTTVKDKIEYKKVDVSDEIKKESQVNAAKEDTAVQNVVESTLTDTVEWVESTKTPIEGGGTEGSEEYVEVPKSDIPDPSLTASLTGMFGDSGAFLFVDGTENTMTIVASGTTFTVGQFVTLNVIGAPSDVSWSKSGDDTLSIDSSTGIVTATAKGTATFTATSTDGDGNTFTASVTITAQEADKPTEIQVMLSDSTLKLKPGESDTLTATTNPEGSPVTWSSSNDAVATVENGTVKAIALGSATISAKTSTGNTATCTVTVSDGSEKSITISSTKEIIAVGKTVTLKATVKGVSDEGVTWESSNPAVCTVSEDGTVTGVTEGSSAVICKSKADSSLTAQCTVTVSNQTEKNQTKLKDKNGNQMYIKKDDGSYVEAVYADYPHYDKFYKKSGGSGEYKYTGWQTIDGKTYFFDKNGNKVTGEQVIKGARYNFGSDGALSTGSGNMGIDVSKWNGTIDWNAVKNAGVSYAIIRCGYRGSSTGALIVDPTFATNIKGATNAGIKVGVYFFTQATSEVEAVEEASMVLSQIGGYSLSYPVYLDVEQSNGRGDGIDAATRTAVCQAFCNTIQNSGYKAGIYANKTWFTEKMNVASLSGYKLWLAQYAANRTYNASRVDMWQYTSKGSINGIKGNVDLNIVY